MNFGWTVEYVLAMPVRRFFAMAKAARKMKEDDRNMLLFELCDVMVCSTGVKDYHEKLSGVYWNRLSFNKENAPKKASAAYDISEREQGIKALMRFSQMMRGR